MNRADRRFQVARKDMRESGSGNVFNELFREGTLTEEARDHGMREGAGGDATGGGVAIAMSVALVAVTEAEAVAKRVFANAEKRAEACALRALAPGQLVDTVIAKSLTDHTQGIARRVLEAMTEDIERRAREAIDQAVDERVRKVVDRAVADVLGDVAKRLRE